MAINKVHEEFHTLDMSKGWETPAGYPPGIQQKILSGALNETEKRGSRTRLLRFAPGVYTTTPLLCSVRCGTTSSYVVGTLSFTPRWVASALRSAVQAFAGLP